MINRKCKRKIVINYYQQRFYGAIQYSLILQNYDLIRTFWLFKRTDRLRNKGEVKLHLLYKKGFHFYIGLYFKKFLQKEVAFFLVANIKSVPLLTVEVTLNNSIFGQTKLKTNIKPYYNSKRVHYCLYVMQKFSQFSLPLNLGISVPSEAWQQRRNEI